MPLSEEQIEKLYETTLENRQDITWIRERLGKCSDAMVLLSQKQSALEAEHSFLKGKLGAFILVITFTATIVINSFVWITGHFIGKS